MEDIKILSDVEAIKTISNSFRLKILQIFQKEGSASATYIADKLDESASKVSYHLKKMEEHDIIRLKEKKVRGNLVEKIFEPVAREFKIELEDKSEKAKIEGGELYPLVKELSSLIEKDLFKLAETKDNIKDDSLSVLSYGSYFLTEKEVKELKEVILSKLKDFRKRDNEKINGEYDEYKIGFLLLDHFTEQ